MTLYLSIPVHGEMRVVDLDGLTALQAHVGGDIEMPSLMDYDHETEFWNTTGQDLVINAEGKFNGSGFNSRASLLFGINHHNDPVMGNVLVAGEADGNGESTDVDLGVVLRVLGRRLEEALLP